MLEDLVSGTHGREAKHDTTLKRDRTSPGAKIRACRTRRVQVYTRHKSHCHDGDNRPRTTQAPIMGKYIIVLGATYRSLLFLYEEKNRRGKKSPYLQKYTTTKNPTKHALAICLFIFIFYYFFIKDKRKKKKIGPNNYVPL